MVKCVKEMKMTVHKTSMPDACYAVLHLEETSEIFVQYVNITCSYVAAHKIHFSRLRFLVKVALYVCLMMLEQEFVKKWMVRM